MEMRKKKMAEKCIFRYSLKNAWGLPLSWIEVLDRDNNNVRVYRFNNGAWNGDTDIIKPETVTVSPAVIVQVKEILRQHPEILRISGTEEPPELEGVKAHLLFADNENSTEITSENLWYFEDKEAKDAQGNEPVRAWTVLKIFNKIREALLKAGIDPYYLTLYYHEED